MTRSAISGFQPKISAIRSRRIVGKFSWTVGDQTLLALANFGGNLILARWLAPIEYGGYMAASALFWMALGVYGGLLTEPMMVFGSGRYREQLPSYFSVLAVFHCCISAIVASVLGAAGLAIILWGSRASGFSLIGYAVAAPVVLLLWLLRRTVYLWSHPRVAAGAAGAYLLGMLAFMSIFYRTGTLSTFTAPLAAAGASLLPIVIILIAARFRLWSSWRSEATRKIVAAHWYYGRWAVVTSIAAWAPGGLYYLLIVPILAGLEANAALNALWNLVMPAIQLNLALTLLLIPAFSRMRQDRRTASLVWAAVVALVAGATLYSVGVGLFGEPIIDVVYRGRYTREAHLAWLVGLAAVPNAAAAVLESVLRARERPDCIFRTYAVSTIVTCMIGIPAVAFWGVLGGILGLLARDVTTMVLELWWVLRTGGWR